jgi:hypothetical protein
MIEALTIFALGFAIASLLPMVVVRCVNGRAERLAISDRSVGPVSIIRTSRAPTWSRLHKGRWLFRRSSRRRNNE